MIPPSKRPWRTLVRVEYRNEKTVTVIIVGWDPHKTIVLHKSDIPDHIWPLMRRDARLHSMVNVGTEEVENLKFTNWEET